MNSSFSFGPSLHHALNDSYTVSNSSVAFLDVLLSIDHSCLTTSYTTRTETHIHIITTSPSTSTTQSILSRTPNSPAYTGPAATTRTLLLSPEPRLVPSSYAYISSALIHSTLTRARSVDRARELYPCTHIPLLLTYHASTLPLQRFQAYRSLLSDPTTSHIFSESPLPAFK